MKTLLHVKLFYLYLTECQYQVVKVTPQNVYRIRKYYKRLPNIRKKYVRSLHYNGVIGSIYKTVEECEAKNEVDTLENQFKWECQELLCKINEKEIPVE